MEWSQGLVEALVIGLLLSISWDVSKIKKKLRDLGERDPQEILERPYGHGPNHAFPLACKPREDDLNTTEQPTEAEARRGEDE